MEKKYLSLGQLSELLGFSRSNVWTMLKKLNVKFRFKGFRKKEYDFDDFIEKLKKHNSVFYQENEKKLLSIFDKNN